MIPIPQTLSARFVPLEAESLSAVSSILPVEGAQSEPPLWSRLRQGTQFTGVILGKEKPATEASSLATFKVQLNLPNQPPAVVLMQLPAQLAQQQSIQMQYMGQPHPAKDDVQVRWGLLPATRSAVASSAAGLQHEMAQSSTSDAELLQASQAGLGQASLVELSSPAKYLHRWINSPLFNEHSAALQAKAVVTHTPQKPQVLAQDLKHALDSSGLFYESHLKEATLGSRSWHQLLQEPQNKPQFMPPEMVAQQLQVLEQQRVVWHGEVWPGQDMHWEVAERDASPHPSEAPALNTMQSDLKLQLPQMGEVAVRIVMVNGRFNVQIKAEASDSVRQMQSARKRLAGSMQAAGLPLDTLQISMDASYASG
ncbi:flagellar hook-length control protein FliK [Methylophilus aquaticus]|uniref:Flagellar hook-length control protein FliK n=1 Tax=Methylophilus aquaticus TaxID=1971610 RepID=A0ABT9JUC4_9PROT|nr:flagellar hook-length control protein FliK [Methylophilus aquaticus]MDP8568129.1 flagellar hook-length control protein FliK [Methylophilus aquaticus]